MLQTILKKLVSSTLERLDLPEAPATPQEKRQKRGHIPNGADASSLAAKSDADDADSTDGAVDYQDSNMMNSAISQRYAAANQQESAAAAATPAAGMESSTDPTTADRPVRKVNKKRKVASMLMKLMSDRNECVSKLHCAALLN